MSHAGRSDQNRSTDVALKEIRLLTRVGVADVAMVALRYNVGLLTMIQYYNIFCISNKDERGSSYRYKLSKNLL